MYASPAMSSLAALRLNDRLQTHSVAAHCENAINQASTSVARSIQQRQLRSLKRSCHTDTAASAALLTPPTAGPGFWTGAPAGGSSAAGGCGAGMAAICRAKCSCSGWPPVPRSWLPLRGCRTWLLGCAAPFGCVLRQHWRLRRRLPWRGDRLSPAGVLYDASLWIESVHSCQSG